MKRIACLILALCLTLPLTVLSVFAAEPTVKEGSARGYRYYYRDDYFAQNASVYNQSFATMTFVMTCAGFASYADGDGYQYRYLETLFGDLGFTDMEVNEDFRNHPGTDTMGVAMAHKTVNLGGKTYTVLAIVPRSAGYLTEWANNFVLGTQGEADGFGNSAKIVEAFAEEYVAKYGKSFQGELKLWVMGYSRGAAVANLVAGHLTKAGKIGGFTVEKENLYAYTFETPRGASTDTLSVEEAKTYTNIHNIVTSNDVVTKVAPLNWGFIRYGVDESVIPEIKTAENAALFAKAAEFLTNESLAAYDAKGNRILASETFQAKKLTSDLTALKDLGTWVKEDGVYTWKPVDSDKAKEVLIVDSDKSMGAVLDDLVTALCTGIGSRRNYYYQVQDLLRLLLSETAGEGYQTEVLTKAKEVLKRELEAQKLSILAAALTGSELYLNSVLSGIASTVIEESGLDAKAYGKLPEQIAALVPILAKTVLADVAISGGSDVISLIENLDCIGNPHYSEQVMAWMMAMDENYNPAVKAVNAAVTDVKVTVTKKTETKKVLFIKTTVTKYEVEILPIAQTAVKEVEYRTLRIGGMKSGTKFTRDLNLSYLYVSVTDANGNVTHWEYQNGKTTQVK